MLMTIHKAARLAALTVVLALITACGGNVTRDDSAANLLPALPDYNVTNTTNITEAVTNAASGAALAAGQAQFTAAIKVIGDLATCYQKAGAIEGRTYTLKSNPFKAGFIVIVNRNKALDPATLAGCLPFGGASVPSPNEYEPCFDTYTLPKGGNEFYILYGATSPQVCKAFCSGLEGCTKFR
jgi:hypothetical protein